MDRECVPAEIGHIQDHGIVILCHAVRVPLREQKRSVAQVSQSKIPSSGKRGEHYSGRMCNILHDSETDCANKSSVVSQVRTRIGIRTLWYAATSVARAAEFQEVCARTRHI